MVYIPPQFSKIGKAVKDMIGKNFSYANEFKTINKSENVEVEVGAKDMVGKGKVTIEDVATAKVEGEFNTQGSISGKATFKKQVEGLEVILKANLTEGNCDGGVEVNYARDFVTTAGHLTHFGPSKGTKLGAAIMFGEDGISCGLATDFSLTGGFKLDDYRLGLQYHQSDFTSSLLAKNKAEDLVFSYHQKIDAITNLGASFLLNESEKLTVAVEHQLDPCTTVKIKADSDSNVAGYFEHRLSQPQLKLGGSISFTIPEAKNNKFGLSIICGDY